MFFPRLRSFLDLNQRLKALEDEMASFRLDWDEMYERYRKMASRVARERARIEELETKQHTENGDELVPEMQPSFSSLTPRQRAITQAILRRRMNLPPAREEDN